MAEIAAGKLLRESFEGGVARLTLDHPERRNALSEALLTKLDDALQSLAENRETRVAVIAATGSVFSSGHDLTGLVGRDPADYARIFEQCVGVMQRIRTLPVPVIARVQGPALAAGCQLVAACDLAIASANATFSTPGVKIGLFCGTPMVPLVRKIPQRIAFEMLITGEPISAQRALEIALVNRVVAPSELDAAIDELMRPILSASRDVIASGKAEFYLGLHSQEMTAYAQAADFMTRCAGSPAAQEGIDAFLGKRKPTWPETRVQG